MTPSPAPAFGNGNAYKYNLFSSLKNTNFVFILLSPITQNKIIWKSVSDNLILWLFEGEKHKNKNLTLHMSKTGILTLGKQGWLYGTRSVPEGFPTNYTTPKTHTYTHTHACTRAHTHTHTHTDLTCRMLANKQNRPPKNGEVEQDPKEKNSMVSTSIALLLSHELVTDILLSFPIPIFWWKILPCTFYL